MVTTPGIISDANLVSLGMSAFTGANRVNLYWMVQDYRFIGEFTTPLDLVTFPFDRQHVQLSIESQYLDNTQLTIYYTDITAIDNVRVDEAQNPIIGWKQLGAQVIRAEHDYLGLSIGGTYSRLIVGLEVERQATFYLLKICMGVMLLIFMCIWVFSLAVDEADRMMGSLQVFAGLITFLFVASADVPKIPYQTRLDVFMNFSFFMVAVMLMIHGASATIHTHAHAQASDTQCDTYTHTHTRVSRSPRCLALLAVCVIACTTSARARISWRSARRSARLLEAGMGGKVWSCRACPAAARARATFTSSSRRRRSTAPSRWWCRLPRAAASAALPCSTSRPLQRRRAWSATSRPGGTSCCPRASGTPCGSSSSQSCTPSASPSSSDDLPEPPRTSTRGKDSRRCKTPTTHTPATKRNQSIASLRTLLPSTLLTFSASSSLHFSHFLSFLFLPATPPFSLFSFFLSLFLSAASGQPAPVCSAESSPAVARKGLVLCLYVQHVHLTSIHRTLSL